MGKGEKKGSSGDAGGKWTGLRPTDLGVRSFPSAGTMAPSVTLGRVAAMDPLDRGDLLFEGVDQGGGIIGVREEYASGEPAVESGIPSPNGAAFRPVGAEFQRLTMKTTGEGHRIESPIFPKFTNQSSTRPDRITSGPQCAGSTPDSGEELSARRFQELRGPATCREEARMRKLWRLINIKYCDFLKCRLLLVNWLHVVFFLLVVGGCGRSPVPAAVKGQESQGPKTINAMQAVGIADQFVRENGYTDFMPKSASGLEPESIEFSENETDGLAERHDTLRPRALGYRMGGRNDARGWTVGFGLVKPREGRSEIGRAVTMDRLGQNVVVQHMGFFLRNLEPRPE